MKGMKKLLSILMVLTLVLSLGASAFAATVTIDVKLDGHTFTAYQIFKGTQGADSGNTLASVEWGSDINPEAFIEALQAIDPDAFKDCDAKDVNTVVKAISEYTGDAKAIAEAALDSLKEGATGQAFSKSTTLDNGYYLIKDTTVGLTGENAYNDVVLQVTEDVKIDYKTNVPTSKKKVQDKNDTTGDETGWQDSADWDIGDDVPFQLTGTLPSNYDDYDTYAITFHDKQSAGLTFKPETVEVKVGDKTLVKDVDYQVVAPGSDGCTFDIVISDLKEAAPEATSASVVEVTYKSTLNTGAVIGSEGNPNDMTMDFSNNPHGDGTGTTPNDHVIVFTYEFNANKVDKDGEKLEGAGFTLLKKVATGGETKTYNEGTPNEVTYDNVIEVKSYTVAPDQTTFDFKGLDDGDYILVETNVPDGYNKADDVEFTITASHDETADDPKLLTFKGEGDGIDVNEKAGSDTAISGKIDTNVVNLTGVELPETGGIGTTIFYIVGAVLVAGAVILLVTKKRVSGMEK